MVRWVGGPCDRLNDGGAFLYLLLLLFFFYTSFSSSSPPSLPSLSLLSLSSSSVLVIHRVDASQLNLTEPLNHGTCPDSFLSRSPRHPPELNLTTAVWSLICFPFKKERVRLEEFTGGQEDPATLKSTRNQPWCSLSLFISLSKTSNAS